VHIIENSQVLEHLVRNVSLWVRFNDIVQSLYRLLGLINEDWTHSEVIRCNQGVRFDLGHSFESLNCVSVSLIKNTREGLIQIGEDFEVPVFRALICYYLHVVEVSHRLLVSADLKAQAATPGQNIRVLGIIARETLANLVCIPVFLLLHVDSHQFALDHQSFRILVDWEETEKRHRFFLDLSCILGQGFDWVAGRLDLP